MIFRNSVTFFEDNILENVYICSIVINITFKGCTALNQVLSSYVYQNYCKSPMDKYSALSEYFTVKLYIFAQAYSCQKFNVIQTFLSEK